MTSLEEGVAGHYEAYDVLARIREGLRALGHDPDHISPEILKSVDEFHIGGAEATVALLEKLQLRAGMDILDIGCGIGGPARMIASHTGARVTGIDLTPGFIDAARELSKMCGMGEQVRFEVASATSLPFPDRSFDLATLLHVGMNIPAKDELFGEAARVLRNGGTFAVYDVMRIGDGTLSYPVPWAETVSLSALEPPETYRMCGQEAGLELTAEESRREIALEFFDRIARQASGKTPSPVGLHLLMGPTVGEKTKNMVAAIKAGIIALIQMIFRKP